jgi:hypothetical protein
MRVYPEIDQAMTAKFFGDPADPVNAALIAQEELDWLKHRLRAYIAEWSKPETGNEGAWEDGWNEAHYHCAQHLTDALGPPPHAHKWAPVDGRHDLLICQCGAQKQKLT